MKTPSIPIKDIFIRIIDEALRGLKHEGWITSDDRDEIYVLVHEKVYKRTDDVGKE